jgi:uncharacterized protein YqjF (DUF2071 family)
MKRPTADDRLNARIRPKGFPVMRQRWSGLLFLHWPVSPESIQATLPPGLHVDTFKGQAWIGVVPFFMDRIRPSLLPPLPGLSWFRELNVRTYVHDGRGVPGVWFHSLDCDQPLAVEIARRFFHLPYEHARMDVSRHDGRIDYRCQRKGCEGDAHFLYENPRSSTEAAEGTLEWFLVERYVLFSAKRDGTLCEGRVHHPPYRIASVPCPKWSAAPIGWNGLEMPSGPPVSILGAEPVDVEVFPLRTI